MNIFVTSKCPVECAQTLDDKRVVKMVLETVQLLCTAINEEAGFQLTQYRSTHKGHPCSKWARASLDNWLWLYNHGTALCNEYTRRYGKVHKSQAVLQDRLFTYALEYFELSGLTPFVNCARNASLGIDYTDIEDTHQAYQLYLADRWDNDRREPIWS